MSNYDAEMSVIGSILLDEKAVDFVAPIVTPEMFEQQSNRIVYETLIFMREVGIAIDTVLLREELKKKKLLDRVGGTEALTRYTDVVPTAANCEYYAKVVRDAYQLRKLTAACKRAIEIVASSKDNAKEVLDECEKVVGDAFLRSQSERALSFRELISEELTDLAKKKDPGIKAGFPNLDEITGGFQPGELTILAARPSMGKTTFAMNIAANMAKEGKRVLLFSLEMSPRNIVRNMMCGAANVFQNKAKSGKINDLDLKRIGDHAHQLADLPIWIDGSPSLSILELKSKARQHSMKYGVDAILIDYMQLIDAKAESREKEVSLISRQLKVMARELQVPVLCLSQLSRAVEKRDNKRPRLSDLRESGSIEQDADLVLMLYRDEYYNQDPDKQVSTDTECILAKHRNGPTGTVYFKFTPSKLQFHVAWR